MGAEVMNPPPPELMSPKRRCPPARKTCSLLQTGKLGNSHWYFCEDPEPLVSFPVVIALNPSLKITVSCWLADAVRVTLSPKQTGFWLAVTTSPVCANPDFGTSTHTIVSSKNAATDHAERKTPTAEFVLQIFDLYIFMDEPKSDSMFLNKGAKIINILYI